MPIVTIQLVTADVVEVASDEIQALADELGSLFNSDPGETWVRVTYLPHTQYAENHATIGSAVQPTFVEILKGSLPEQDVLAKEAEHITQIVSARLSRPIENTHVLYLPAGIGRIAFGGNLVRA